MSKTTIRNNPDDEYKEAIHFVPVQMEESYDGSSEQEITNYFTKRIESSEDGKENNLSQSLRGYPLNGKNYSLPEGFKGLILKDGSRQRLSVKEEKEIRSLGAFNSFHYWNYDKDVDAPDDGLQMAMEWIPIAEALHSA